MPKSGSSWMSHFFNGLTNFQARKYYTKIYQLPSLSLINEFDWLNFDFCMLTSDKKYFFNANDSLAPRPFCKVSRNFYLSKKWRFDSAALKPEDRLLGSLLHLSQNCSQIISCNSSSDLKYGENTTQKIEKPLTVFITQHFLENNQVSICYRFFPTCIHSE